MENLICNIIYFEVYFGYQLHSYNFYQLLCAILHSYLSFENNVIMFLIADFLTCRLNNLLKHCLWPPTILLPIPPSRLFSKLCDFKEIFTFLCQFHHLSPDTKSQWWNLPKTSRINHISCLTPECCEDLWFKAWINTKASLTSRFYPQRHETYLFVHWAIIALTCRSAKNQSLLKMIFFCQLSVFLKWLCVCQTLFLKEKKYNTGCLLG